MEKIENEDISLNKDEIVGFAVHDLSKRFKTFLQNLNEEEGADPAAVSHGWLIGYLYDNRDKVIYQRDLEEQLHLAKSSIATILQTLEQAGYIRRETPPHDARQKQVILTPEGREFDQRMRRRIMASEKQVRKDIPAEDMEVFFRVLRKMAGNLS